MIILSQWNFTHDWELYLLHLCKRRRERCEFEEMYEDNREMVHSNLRFLIKPLSNKAFTELVNAFFNNGLS